MTTSTHEKVSEYYGRVLNSKSDLKTGACCLPDSMPDFMKDALSLIEDEVLDKFYGCGSPIPYNLRGKKILDLGCGTGRDVFLLSYFAGEDGEVIGVDMTEEQLSLANYYLPMQMEKFGYSKPNVQFKHGYIEDLKSLDIPDNYFDIVVSNCVVNLSPDKEAVLNEVFRVLKEGGEFYFSDVYADRRLPSWAAEDEVLLGECLGGALYWKDFERTAKKTGFLDPRIYTNSEVELYDQEVIDKIGYAKFTSITYRLFKLPNLEDACEDYGQVAYYNGGIPNSPHTYKLDDHHILEKGKPMPVCSNSASMLADTHLKEHFKIVGDLSTHYGLFEGCGETPIGSTNNKTDSNCC